MKKKYSVYSLKVVEIKKDTKNYYFICEHDIIKNTYIELFTNEEINSDDIVSIESLSEYYSLIERCNYKTGRVLRVGKKELLKKCLDINILKQNQEPKKLKKVK